MSFGAYLDMWWAMIIRLFREIALAIVMLGALILLAISVGSTKGFKSLSSLYEKLGTIEPGTPEAFKFGQEN